MHPDFLVLIGQVVFAGVALLIITFDLREMRIPDALSGVLIALFAGLCLVAFPEDFWARLVLSGAVFALGFAAFFFRIMGGGDVKIMTVLALFVPVQALAQTALLYSATLVLGTVIVLLLRRYVKPHAAWAFLNTPRMPMGVCIGMAAFLAPFVLTT